MKLFILSLTILLAFSFSGISQVNCTPTLDSNTIVIKSDTVLACGTTESYLICPRVKVSYTDNSCFSKFYLESNAFLTFDSTTSYGYSDVWMKDNAILDANFRQFGKLYYPLSVLIKDTNETTSTSPLISYSCPTYSFIYSNLPGGVSGCGAHTSLKTIKIKTPLFEVYPNPSNEFINVKTDLEHYSLKLFNSVGKLVWAGTSKRIELNYPEGVYFLKIEDGENSLTKKVVVN